MPFEQQINQTKRKEKELIRRQFESEIEPSSSDVCDV